MCVPTLWHNGGACFLQKRVLQQARKFAEKDGLWGGNHAGSEVQFLSGLCPGWSLLRSNSFPVQLSCALVQVCLWISPPPLPSLVTGGLWNRNSAHIAPLCACAMETVSCNDMRIMYCPWRVCIAALLFAMTTKMEFASVRAGVRSGPWQIGALVPLD